MKKDNVKALKKSETFIDDLLTAMTRGLNNGSIKNAEYYTIILSIAFRFLPMNRFGIS